MLLVDNTVAAISQSMIGMQQCSQCSSQCAPAINTAELKSGLSSDGAYEKCQAVWLDMGMGVSVRRRCTPRRSPAAQSPGLAS